MTIGMICATCSALSHEPHEIKKTKLDHNCAPQHCINTLLPAVAIGMCVCVGKSSYSFFSDLSTGQERSSSSFHAQSRVQIKLFHLFFVHEIVRGDELVHVS